MKISELAARSGLSVHTIRYYERIGLLPPAPRQRSGQRDYGPDNLAFVAFIERMRVTGMPIRTMLAYARLRTEGPQTGKARQDILIVHRQALKARLDELQACVAVLDAKIDSYNRQDCEFAGASNAKA